MNARLQIRRRTGRGPVGFLIVGRDSLYEDTPTVGAVVWIDDGPAHRAMAA